INVFFVGPIRNQYRIAIAGSINRGLDRSLVRRDVDGHAAGLLGGGGARFCSSSYEDRASIWMYLVARTICKRYKLPPGVKSRNDDAPGRVGLCLVRPEGKSAD